MTRRYKLLGPLEIKAGGRLSPVLKRPKASALIAYLIVTGQLRPREALADLLWESTSTAEALRNLRTTLARIRGDVPELHISRTALAFQPGPETFVDYSTLEAVLEHTAAIDAADAAATRLDHALALYRGELLADFSLSDAPRFEAWLVAERERLRQAVVSAYARLSQIYLDAERWAVTAAIGTAAAASKVRLAGFATSSLSGTATYSAKPPPRISNRSPNTASPG